MLIALIIFVVLCVLLRQIPKEKRMYFILALYVISAIFFWPRIKQIIVDVDSMVKTEVVESVKSDTK